MLSAVLGRGQCCLTDLLDLPFIPSHPLIPPLIFHDPAEDLFVFNCAIDPSFLYALLDVAQVEVEDLERFWSSAASGADYTD